MGDDSNQLVDGSAKCGDETENVLLFNLSVGWCWDQWCRWRLLRIHFCCQYCQDGERFPGKRDPLVWKSKTFENKKKLFCQCLEQTRFVEKKFGDCYMNM